MVIGRVECIADFEPQNDFELGLNKGDMVNVTAKLNETWLDGECNGNTGELGPRYENAWNLRI